MRSLRVIPDEPGNQFSVKLIGTDQQFLMVIDEFFLNGPIKPFYVSVHLGSFGIGMPVLFVQASNFLIEVLHELRAIVGQYRLKWIGKHLGDDSQEFSGGQRRMALSGPGKGEARIVIGEGDNVSPDAIEKVFHRVKGAAFTGSAGFIAFGFSPLMSLLLLDSLSIGPKLHRPAAHLIGGIGDDPPDGSRSRTA